MKCDSTVRTVSEAYISVNTLFLSGKAKVLCMTSPLYDFIIGNVNGAWDVTNPDPHWRTKQVCDVNKSSISNIVRISDGNTCSCEEYTGKQHVSWFIMDCFFFLLFLYFRCHWECYNILFKQFFVHIQHRKTVMTLTYGNVFAGHLGMHRTTEHVFLTVMVLEFRDTSADSVVTRCMANVQYH